MDPIDAQARAPPTSREIRWLRSSPLRESKISLQGAWLLGFLPLSCRNTEKN